MAENNKIKLIFEDSSTGAKSEYPLSENTRFHIIQDEIVFYNGKETTFSLLGNMKILYAKESTSSIETVDKLQIPYIIWGYDSFSVCQPAGIGICEIYNLKGVRYKVFKLTEQTTTIPFSALQNGVSIIKLGNNTYKIRK